MLHCVLTSEDCKLETGLVSRGRCSASCSLFFCTDSSFLLIVCSMVNDLLSPSKTEATSFIVGRSSPFTFKHFTESSAMAYNCSSPASAKMCGSIS
uniref:Uncharacterized protein n=1 Tax=Arundo donax TaxID=35708 RepID=A0A0A9AR51_ARUDO